MYNGCRNVCYELSDGTGLKSKIVIIFVIFIFYMKYLITESKLNQVIFRYLNNQDFIQINKGATIFFVNSENDEYSEIRYDKISGWCYIVISLVDEVSSFFSLKHSVSNEVIGRWVENTLQMKVMEIRSSKPAPNVWIRVNN